MTNSNRRCARIS